mgnify:CR=1 FL=1
MKTIPNRSMMLTASDYHCKVIKKENTVLYVTAYPEYKEDAEKLVKELGY